MTNKDVIENLKMIHLLFIKPNTEEHYGEKDTLTNYCPHCGADMREGATWTS